MPLHPNELAPPQFFTCTNISESDGTCSLLVQTCYTCGLSVRSYQFYESRLPHKLNSNCRTPATPAVDSVWPTLPLMLKTKHGLLLDTKADTALTSMGSPKAVPVPWA